MLAMASVGTPIAEAQRPRQKPKGRPSKNGKGYAEVELAGKKADFVIIDEIPPVPTRAVVSPHPATKPKKQSDSLKRMLRKRK